MTLQPVILAGGTGSRLWPLSRELYPKQVINLTGDQSLLQTTVQRVAALEDAALPIIVVGEEHRFMARSQVEDLGLAGDCRIILEPLGKNTAPAICGTAEYLAAQGHGDDVMLVLPADHLILDTAAFARAVADRVIFIDQGAIVESAPPEDFFERPVSDRARKFLNIFQFDGVKKEEHHDQDS